MLRQADGVFIHDEARDSPQPRQSDLKLNLLVLFQNDGQPRRFPMFLPVLDWRKALARRRDQEDAA